MNEFDFDRSIEESVASIESLRDSREAIFHAAKTITEAFLAGRKVFFVGNGGSAADAQHSAAEFVGKLGLGVSRKPLPAIALTTDTSAITAIANDFGFEEIYAKQLEALGKSGDVLVAISTSGFSANVVRAAECAQCLGIDVISLAGPNRNCPLLALSKIKICIEASTTPRIQTAHSVALHLICEIVEKNIAKNPQG